MHSVLVLEVKGLKQGYKCISSKIDHFISVLYTFPKKKSKKKNKKKKQTNKTTTVSYLPTLFFFRV